MTTTNPIEWRTETNTVVRRQIAKCGKCKRAHAIDVSITIERTYRSDKAGTVGQPRRTATLLGAAPHGLVKCGATFGMTCCGRSWDYRSIEGTRNDAVKCNAKCVASKGHLCECECGGKNHGTNHG